MQIHGTFHPPAPYPGQAQAGNHPQQRPAQDEQTRQTHSIPAPQDVKAAHDGYSQPRKRFSAAQQDLSHSAKQAINTYVDSDTAGGPELMPRVDVYA